MNHNYAVYLWLDVGNGEHQAVSLDTNGKRLHDAPLPNTEPKLRLSWTTTWAAPGGRAATLTEPRAGQARLPDQLLADPESDDAS